MSIRTGSLREREWEQALDPLFSCDAPDRHVVLDEALAPSALTELRSELLSSWAWQYRAQPGYVLCLDTSDSAILGDVKARLGEVLNGFRPGLAVREEWAFLHQRPFEEFVHSDMGGYVWTLWLTPEKWDRSPDTSGLQLFPLARPADMPNSRQHTVKYFSQQQVTRSAYVPYQENRAIMFPASTFHSIGPCHFDASEVARMRCSVSLFFDTEEHWQAQRGSQTATSVKAGHEF